jgi:hypothetical protein
MEIIWKMTISHKLLARLNENLGTFEEGLSAFFNAMPVSQSWIQREWLLSDENPAQKLLIGAKVALTEAGTAWAIGSNRGAASSLRALIESTFGWLYYKDHPVEFRVMLERQMDMVLPKAVQSYMKSIDGGWEKAYSFLLRKKSRPSEYFYTDVSHFVHAHPAFTSKQVNIEETSISVPREASFLTLCAMTDEFISDNYVTFYRASWGDVPKPAQENALSRLGKSLKQFVDAV